MPTPRKPRPPRKPARAPKPPRRATIKTQATRTSAADFIAGLDDARRADCEVLDRLMRAATGEPGVLWGSAIVGYGQRLLRYESGRELEWMRIGFSPRKQALTVYLVDGVAPHAANLARLGPHETGKGCLYLPRLAEVNLRVLEAILRASVKAQR